MAVKNIPEKNDIPEELTSRRAWVAFFVKPRQGQPNKFDKVPVSRKGRLKAWDKPDAWSTFDEAVERVERGDVVKAWGETFPLVGVGMVMPDDVLVVDIDDCFEGEGDARQFKGGLASPASRYFDKLASWSEVSLSGKGLHVFVNLPEDERKTLLGDATKTKVSVRGQEFELIGRGNFVAMTGVRQKPFSHVRNATNILSEILDASKKAQGATSTSPPVLSPPVNGKSAQNGVMGGLTDEEVIVKATNASNGAQVARLLSGDTTSYNGDASRADLALCQYLAFYASDKAQVDRLFRSSALMREKWDKAHSAQGLTYGEMTIGKAWSTRGDAYTGGRSALDASNGVAGVDPQGNATERHRDASATSYSVSDDGSVVSPWRIIDAAAMLQPLPPVKFAVEGLFTIPSVNIVYGEPGGFKSMLFQDMAVCIAHGVDWLPVAGRRGRKTKASKVLWLDADNGARRTMSRLGAGLRHKGGTTDNLIAVSMPNPHLDLTNASSVAILRATVEAQEAEVVFLDNLGIFKGDADENSADMAKVMASLRSIAEDCGVCVVVIHHARKGKEGGQDSLRGSSSIIASVDVALRVLRENLETNDVDLIPTKARDVFPGKLRGRFRYVPDANNPLDLSEMYFEGLLPVAHENRNAVRDAVIDYLRTNGATPKTKLANDVYKEVQAQGYDASREFVRSWVDEVVAPANKSLGVRAKEGSSKRGGKGLYYFLEGQEAQVDDLV